MPEHDSAGHSPAAEELVEAAAEGKPIPTTIDSVRSDQLARDELVERATRGLIRLDGRRRRRVIAKRLLQIFVVVALIGAGSYYGSRYIPKATVLHYWEELKSKMPDLQQQPRDAATKQ